ncbi:DUF1349 domain-containing protein [Microbacterium sp. CPCC 204701]|nr:DUF1349 domain-containing protein [Microbacterium sp. CPCC 204701]
MTDTPVRAGFLAQAPLGDGATATFTRVRYTPGT